MGACGGVSVVAGAGVPPHPPLRQEPALRTPVRPWTETRGAERGGEEEWSETPACPLHVSLVVAKK